jgi:DNA-binding transcriptional ArsR family regulator
MHVILIPMKARTDINDLQEIRTALEEIRADLRKVVNVSDREGVRSRGPEVRVIDIMMNQLLEDIDTDLEKGMVRKCGMRDTCKAVFTDLLQGSASLIGSDGVSEEIVNKYRSELERRRDGAPKSQCARCFGEVSSLFDKHIRLTRSMRIYRTDEDIRKAMESISEDSVVKEILEPISSRQRLQILKMLSAQARPFSFISEQSGLRGGNLLFHLQRLMDAGMIIQHYERGDYLLTERGYMVLRGITDLAMSLGKDDPTGPATSSPVAAGASEKKKTPHLHIGL